MKYYAVRKGHHPGIIAGEWAQAEPLIKKEISGFPNPQWKGFPTRAQAEAYLAEAEADGSASAAQAPSEAACSEDALAAQFQFPADAVIFVDGSRNFDNVDFDLAESHHTLNKPENFYFASYGIIIFYRDGSVYIENARIDDGDFIKPEDSCFYTTRHSFTMAADGTVSPVEDSTEKVGYEQWQNDGMPQGFKKYYALASWNVVGEVEGAKRALDLCLHQRNLNSAYVFFDCDQIDIIKKIFQGKKPQLCSNVTYNYGAFCRKLCSEGKHVGTMHVYSHSKGARHGLKNDWRWELFNSCVDVLAKAETYNKPIDAVKENRPLRDYGLTPFEDSLDAVCRLSEEEMEQVIDRRRRHAFQLIQKVLADPKARPEFI